MTKISEKIYNKAEILAPAGNIEMLKTVIANGADSVYLGVGGFHARTKADDKADSFNLTNLCEWINYAHLFGVRVYLTLNVLIKDSEMPHAINTAVTAYSMGIDAAILQDLGLAQRLKKEMPALPLHASTQMGIHNLEGARVAENLGFDRVILSRETMLSDIIRIKKGTGLELEAFVHGAQCVSFSGNCYFSSYLSGYSGNRGKCMQLCRKKYDLDGFGEGYWLSPKDLCRLSVLDALSQAGIDCFKIEGRLRRAEYAGEAVRIYKNAVTQKRAQTDLSQNEINKAEKIQTDKIQLEKIQTNTIQANQADIDKINVSNNVIQTDINNSDIINLKKLFNRGDYSIGRLLSSSHDIYPYAQGHIGLRVGKINSLTIKSAVLSCNLHKGDGVKFMRHKRETGSALISADGNITGFSGEVKAGDDVMLTTDAALNSGILSRQRKLNLDIKIELTEGQNITAHLFCDDFSYSFVSEIVPQKAVTEPLSLKTIQQSFSKLGDSIYNLQNLSVNCGDVFLARSQLNALRRDMITAFDIARLTQYNLQKFVSAKTGITLKEIVDKSGNGNTLKANTVFKPEGIITQVSNADMLTPEIIAKSDYICLNPDDYNKIDLNRLKDYGKSLILNLPIISSGGNWGRDRSLGSFDGTNGDFEIIKAAAEKFDILLVNNLYGLSIAGGKKVILGPWLNLINSEINLPRVLSPEADRTFLDTDFIYAGGRIPLMTLCHCVRRAAGHICGKCSGERLTITDDHNVSYDLRKVIIKNCYTQVLGGECFGGGFGRDKKNMGKANLFIDLTYTENPKEFFINILDSAFLEKTFNTGKSLTKTISLK